MLRYWRSSKCILGKEYRGSFDCALELFHALDWVRLERLAKVKMLLFIHSILALDKNVFILSCPSSK